MDWVKELSNEAEDILTTKWEVRNGTVISESEDVTLKDGAVKLSATFLYADLANSSRLAKLCPWETTAKIIRAYLACCTRLIIAYAGAIRSFDGDRVMGVFHGDLKNTHAVRCAREIDWVVEKIIDVKAREEFKSIKTATSIFVIQSDSTPEKPSRFVQASGITMTSFGSASRRVSQPSSLRYASTHTAYLSARHALTSYPMD